MRTEDAPAFTVEDVGKSYRLGRHVIPVLRRVGVTVGLGEWVALVGASGSGKTTLLHLLGSLDRPDAGRIACLGEFYRALSSRRRAHLRRETIGLLFQSYHLFPELNAVENAALPALRWGQDRRAVCARARDLLVGFGLEERLRHRPQELSGGEQQRVALARALINDPRILLADEPTGNLDEEAGEQVLGIIEQLNRDQGRTVVMVTHDMAVAHRADRILRLVDGCIAQ